MKTATRVLFAILWFAFACLPIIARGPLTFEERVKAQEAIERVDYSHRLWPKENPQPKPPFEQMVPRAVIEAKVTDYLKKCAALDKFWQRPIQPEQLQAEMDRMAKGTKNPVMLKELFAALGNDPALIAECLARPALVERLAHSWYEAEDPDGQKAWEPSASSEREDRSRRQTLKTFSDWWESVEKGLPLTLPIPSDRSAFPYVSVTIHLDSPCEPAWVYSSLNEGIDPKASHTAVWTGTEMIVWGGGFPYSLNSGGRYRPATDTWSITSLGAGCPSPRYGHTAVWTGTEMIVWGGSDENGYVQSGGRYNPQTDSWTSTSVTGACPSSRLVHSAVWTGARMIIWGGFVVPNPSYVTNTGGLYDPYTDTWMPASTGTGCPVARGQHTAVWTGSLMIVWGGWSGGSYCTSGGQYNPSSDSWLPTSTGTNCPVGRIRHAAVWSGSRMIVWGGQISAEGTTETGGRYDPVANAWTSTSTGTNCPSPRRYFTGIWTGSELIVWGGELALATGGRYNPTSDTWTSTPTSAGCPIGRYDHTAIWTGTEMVVWGGRDATGNWLKTGGRLKLSTGSWVPTFVPNSMNASCPVGRDNAQSVWTGAEMIIWGGYWQDDWYNPYPQNSGGRYDPATDSWLPTSTGTNCPTPRYGHTAVWTGSKMIVWGGMTASANFNTGGRYDPVLDSWSATSAEGSCPSARGFHKSVWTGSEMIVWGGWDRDVQFNTGGRYSPTTDTWLATSTGLNCPIARHGHTAIWTGSNMVVWGGKNYSDPDGDLDTGGRYDPALDSWQPTSTGAACPEGRTSHSAVWTGSEMIVWGGVNSGLFLNSGGKYDVQSDTWTATSTGVDCPASRASPSAVWTGEAMIIWGGTATNKGGLYDPSLDLWNPTPVTNDTPQARDRQTAIWTGSEMIVWGGHPSSASGGIYQFGAPLNPLITGLFSNTCPTATVNLTVGDYATYQWRYNGAPIAGATLDTLVVGLSGEYSVDLSTPAGCTGSSRPHAVTIIFCANSEVSPMDAVYPAHLKKDASSPTGTYLYFQKIDGVTGYNLYEGTVGAWYSHGGAPGNLCGIVATDLGNGEMRVPITPSAGNHYYLVTAKDRHSEGPSGYSSTGVAIDPAQSTCSP